MTQTLPVGVAAGHPATAAAGRRILAEGGSAGDAVTAMILAASVAETLFTGLGGGGFATHYDAATGEVRCHDFFVAVPGLDGTVPGPARHIAVSFGGVAVPYEIGGATVAVPGTPAGAEHLHRTHGRLPWADVVAPALDLACSGAELVQAHADLLPDVVAAMLVDAGADAYSRPGANGDRVLLAAGDTVFHRGLTETFQVYAAGGAAALMSGEFARHFVDAVRADGGALSMADLAAYRVTTRTPRTVDLGSVRIQLRGNDLDDVAGTLAAFAASDPPPVQADPAGRALAMVRALAGTARRGDTTAAVAVDAAGNVCAATHSLGLGSGIWVDGVHGNSMLGEGELLRATVHPGDRMGSMMSPLIGLGPDGRPVLAGGAAGGSRIRSALLQVIAGIVLDGLPAQAAVNRPRLSVGGDTVHLEPGFPEEVPLALARAGYAVSRWPQQRPFFGGAAFVAASGFAADPRRSGAAFTLD